MEASSNSPFSHHFIYVARTREVLVEEFHVVAQFLHRNLSIDLSGGDIGVAQYAADTLDGHSGIEGHDGKGVAGTVEGDVFGDAAARHQSRHLGSQGAVVDRGEDGAAATPIAVDDVEGFRQQSRHEDRVSLLPVRLYPLFAVYGDDVGRAEMTDVDIRHAGQRSKDKEVAGISQGGLRQPAVHEPPQFLLRQVFAVADVLADVEVGKGAGREQLALAGPVDDALQHLGEQPDGAGPHLPLGAQVERIVADELAGEFREWNVLPVEDVSEEAGQALSRLSLAGVGTGGPVPAHSAGKSFEVAIVSLQQ